MTTGMSADRTLPWDWYDARVPLNVSLDPSSYIETTFSFVLFQSQRSEAVSMGRGASAYLGTMFDVGRHGRVSLGDYVLLNGARLICDAEIIIEDYALLSWNVVVMDNYRVSIDPDARREEVRAVATSSLRRPATAGSPRPIRIGRAAWIGFDSCVLPGVNVGEGAVVGARSVVMDDVAPFTIVAGNPARLVRPLTPDERRHGL